MSRSNPTNNNSPNPATRWFDWSGSKGEIRYYDKTDKRNVSVALPFTFILLDQLSTVKGWHDPSESAIYANEVKDTRAETLVVKAFKAGVLAEGFYSQIRDRVIAHGGHFTANLYIAFKGETRLDIGSLQFKGAALGSWMEFSKEHRADLYKKAVVIDGFTEGKKGQVVFRLPKFRLKDIATETDEAAKDLDRELQEYLANYFKRTRTEQAAKPVNNGEEEPPDEWEPPMAPPIEDDPF